MLICEIWMLDWYFPQFCKSDMSMYGYLEVFQRVPSTSRYRESTVLEHNFDHHYPYVRSGGGVVDNTLDYQSRGRKIDPPLLRSFG